VADRLNVVAEARGWWLPALSTAATVIAVTVFVWSRRQVDLGTYLMGGAHAFSSDLYRVQYPITHLGFTYPPFPALLFAPFAHLPLRLVTVSFTWISLGALFGLVAVSLRATTGNLCRRSVVWWSLVFMTPAVLLGPVRETLGFGQVNLVLALAVVADILLTLPIPKGVLVGLAAAVKITPFLLIPYLFLTGRRRAGWTALAAFASAAAVAAVASPRASWTYWSHDAWFASRAGSLPYIANQGMIGVVDRLRHHSLSTGATFAIVVAVSAVGLAVATFTYRRSWMILGFIVMEATESLASPVSWDHHFVWIIVLIAWLALGSDGPARGLWWAAAVALAFWAAPIWWIPHAHHVRYAGSGWSIPVANFFSIVLVAVVAGAAGRLLLRGRGSIPSTSGATTS
jgi:alpha-1,2-mannosyltransferase